MRDLVAAVFACCIIALLLVSGCTYILSKQKDGGFGDVPPIRENRGGAGGCITGSSSGDASVNGKKDFYRVIPSR